MSKPKLLQVLEQLSSEEVKKFQAYFIKNHSRKKVQGAILNGLIKVHPKFGNTKEALRETYQRVSPTYSEGKRFSNEMGKINACLEDFLVAQYMEAEQFERDLCLAKVFLKKGLREAYLNKLKDIDAQLDKEKKGLWHWLKKMQVSHQNYFNPFKDQKEVSAAPIYESLAHAKQFYIAVQLRYACELYNRHIILKEEPPAIPDLEDLIADAISSPSLFHQSYALLAQLILKRSDDIYFQLKEKVCENIAHFQHRDLYILFTYLCNYIAWRVRNGEQSFLQEQFDLMQIFIPNKVFIIDGKFNHGQFINIIDTGSKLKKFAWLERFIEQWQMYLPVYIRPVILSLAKALMLFYQNKFTKAAKLANDIHTKDIQLELRRRWLILQAYYEEKEYQSLVLNFNSYETFVRRKGSEGKLNEMHQQAAMKVSYFLKRMIKIEPNKKKLAADLDAAENIFLKSWLQEKISQLK